ncbi:inositol monophosphatase [Mesorhizobium tianshanense]|uniref:Inositol-1-monophosphatase n=1 Tax=Mesorhizobium tianshanense TaxID=39844 RepID=A0A562PBU3_9HYPH|nr:inositol monophosphatase family protein [Mesorhizobium tianshanense]TWI41945.1 myo-inositol-1(or 4)-monophosphatase [Mesorhizobium tianshanense]GLS34732.1 inositol monophosphatase [Mesorhizobium tianshanense]
MAGDNNDRMLFATALAQRGGELGMQYFRQLETLTIESKGHQDLVSEADRNVETFIRQELAAQYPEDGVIGEEHAALVGGSGYTWVIDPIDGTANFLRGIPAWTVVIACVKDGVTVVGVIHEPSTGETFYGRRGGGAFLNNRAIKTSPTTSLTQGSVGTGFSNRREARNIANLIDLLLQEGGVFFRNASGALMLAYVASGRLLAYVEEHMNAWDCLAGMLLVEEAGGLVVTPDPKTVLEEGTLVIAGGKGVFDKVHALCKQAFSL